MKALALTPGTTQLKIIDIPEPKIEKPDDIKVQTLLVGICGTDREEASGGRADAPQGEKELIIGHEMFGRVVEVGSDVKGFKKGDHLVFTVRRGCNACPACKIFRFDMCTTGSYTERGIKGRHGFECEFVVDQECYAIKADKSIISVLTEPMSVVEKAIDEATLLQTARLPYFHGWHEATAVVAGLGPVGLLAALILSLRGAKVIGIDIASANSPRVKIFNTFGGTYYNDKSCDPAKMPKADLIVEAAGVAKLDFDLLEMLNINGAYVLTGVPGAQHPVSVDAATLMRKLVLKNQVMVGSVNASIEHFKKGVDDLKAAVEKWPGVVDKMITQKYPYTDFQKVFSEHSPDEIKVVLEWSSM